MNRQLLCVLIVSCVAFVAVPAAAEDWEETFSGDSLPDELTEARVVVATGGPQSGEIGEILVEQLKDAGAPEAMLNPVFDDIGDRSDKEVVSNLEHLPVDVIVVLRAFGDEQPPEEADGSDDEEADGSDDEEAGELADSGMLTVYAIDGETIAGFMVYPGERLTREQRRNVGRGISQEAIDATRETVEREDDKGTEEHLDDHVPKEERRYDLEKRADGSIGLHDRKEDQTYTGVDIYHQLGDEDLAAEYERLERSQKTRRWVTGSIALSGVAATAVGAGLAYHYQNAPIDDDHPEVAACDDYTNERVRQNCRVEAHGSVVGTSSTISVLTATAGAVIAAAGGASYLWTRSAKPHPLDRTELIRKVNNVNIEKAAEDSDDVDSENEEEHSYRPPPEPAAGPVAALAINPSFATTGDIQGGVSLRIQW